jgi:hypothetical protein
MPDIFTILDDLGRNVAALRESLSPLRAFVGKDGPFPMFGRPARKKARRRRARRVGSAKPGRQAKVAAAPTRRRKPRYARVRALQKQQGRYMGFVRTRPAAQKAKVKKVRGAKGVKQAIKLAASMRSA